jgi:hypothetical protein
MPNIHTLREIRTESGGGNSNVPYRPAPSSSSLSNIGTIGSLRSGGGGGGGGGSVGSIRGGPASVRSYNTFARGYPYEVSINMLIIYVEYT